MNFNNSLQSIVLKSKKNKTINYSGQMPPSTNSFSGYSLIITTQTGNKTFLNGSYTVTYSSVGDGASAYLAFNNNSNDFWHCSYSGNPGSTPIYTQIPYDGTAGISKYIGGTAGSTTSNYAKTTIDGTSYPGEWIQINYPFQFILTSYLLYQRSGYLWNQRGPSLFYVAGSNDNGTTWSMVDSQNITTAPGTMSITINITNNNKKYSSYRIIFNKVFNSQNAANNVVNIAEWNLFGDYYN